MGEDPSNEEVLNEYIFKAKKFENEQKARIIFLRKILVVIWLMIAILASVITAHIEQNPELKKNIQEFIPMCVKNSRDTAKKLFIRSGWYLFIGVIIASSGIMWFYTSRDWVVSNGELNINLLIEILPRAGVLLFIELMAFFFLKQSRSIMDEFKYFDSIARHREESMFLIKFAIEKSEGINSIQIAEKGWFFSKAEKLRVGETTEILESRKIEGDQIITSIKTLLDKNNYN